MKFVDFIISFIFILAIFLILSNGIQKRNVVASVIASESCGEGIIGMYAVANTIRNRAIKYQKSPYKIVTQPNQYYGYTVVNKDKIYQECKKDANYLADRLMELIDITDGALYFKCLNEPKKKWHKIKTVTIKNHTFYK